MLDVDSESEVILVYPNEKSEASWIVHRVRTGGGV